MELNVGSAPARTSILSHAGLTLSDSSSEPPLSGFLNRKCVIEAGGKKSKDRSWQTFWCQLKGVALEFHRVDGVRSEGFKPPPRDIYPPPHLAHHKAGFVSVDGAKVAVDYTSQIGKDLQKRRSWLFELTLSNSVVYLLQAPNSTQRAQWVQQIHKAASGQGDDVEGRKLKAARCSVRHRSRQNVLSLKAGAAVIQGEADEADIVTAVREHPHMQLLRDRLKAKKELLSQINRMCYSFLGDSRQMYSEEAVVKKTSVVDPHSSPRRLSLPSPGYSLAPPTVADYHRTGAFIATTHYHPSVRSHLLQDYLLVPGANWSQLREGDEVLLTARLPNGWYRCLVQRDVTTTVHGVGSVSVSSQLSEASGDSGLPPSNRHSTASDTLPEAPSPTPPAAPNTADPEMFTSDDVNTEDTEESKSSVANDNSKKSHDPKGSPRLTRVERSYSYIAATQSNIDTMMGPNPRRSLDPTMFKRSRDILEVEEERSKHSSVVVSMLDGLLSHLSESHAHDSYRFPLVGLVPPSVVQKVPEMSNLPLIHVPTFPHSSSNSTIPLPSPAHSLSQSDTPQHSVSNGTLPTPTHSLSLLPVTPSQSPLPSRKSVSPSQSPLPPRKPVTPTQSPLPSRKAVSPSHSPVPSRKAVSPSHSPVPFRKAVSPSHSPVPSRKPVSSPAPGSSPANTPCQSPTPAAPHAPNGESRDEKLPRNLPLLSPSKSPTHRPRTRRRSNDPVTAVLESGPSLIKKLLPRKKHTKQSSLPDKLSVFRTSTIEEDVVYSPSPSPLPPSPPPSPIPPTISPPPPPAMLDFTERELESNLRTRVSSVSGRPVRSTGICLQFGEEESSSESDLESISEEPPNKLSFSLSLPTGGGFLQESEPLHSSSPLTSALLLPPNNSPHTRTPGKLKRAASANDSLNVNKVETEPISQVSRSKSGSSHSLTATIVRGLQASFRRNHVHSEDPASPKKRGSSKRKRRGSCSEGTETESPRIGGIFRHPPTGQKRFVYLDPRQPKYGFRLESYGRPSDLGREIRVFVQSVTPGSPAFMSGLFPGDTILEVNGVSVRSEPVAAVVKRITDVPRKSENKIQLTVMFADGVTRLDMMKKNDHLKYQMKMKQAQLRVMKSEEFSHLTTQDTTPLPPARSLQNATDLVPWSQHPEPSGPTANLYPCDNVLNEQVSLYSGPPSELATDVLVLPLCVDLHRDNHNMLTQLVLEGGADLVDDLCLSSHCLLGENIVTSGYRLPANTVYHCVFGNLEESLQKCVWSALENGCSEKPVTIAFWLDGFTTINVSPHTVIELVRLWLQQGGNCHKYKKIVFSAAANPNFAEMLLARYFPLSHYHFMSGAPGIVSRPGRGNTELHESTERVEEQQEEGEEREQKEREGKEDKEVEAKNKGPEINCGLESGEQFISSSSPTDDATQSSHLCPSDHSQLSTPPHSPSSSARTLNPHRLESDV